ncbi:MAG: flagellar basal body L-ring protein FlgH [Pseudomonadota bacterium]
MASLLTHARLFTACLLLGLSACAHIEKPLQPDPDYAASYPTPQPQPSAYQGGAIYQAQSAQELFRDARAYRVGDILTVNLTEQTDAETRSSTSTAKDDTVGVGVTTLLGITPTVNGDPFTQNYTDASRNFTGSGNSTQSNSLEGSLTVVVAQVFGNGNLLVRGEKIVSINQGEEYVRLSGIVRLADIAPDNTVSSTRIANARISYGGGGALAQANSAGWLSRFFSSEYWPF